MSPRVRAVAPLEAALDYARCGWSVIPLFSLTPDGACTCRKGAACESRGKHPRLTDWPQHATTDEATIREWLIRWPTANIGIATGARSGLFALDVDPRHGGDESLALLEAQHGPLPRTVRQLSGGGGEHVLFRHPGWPVGNQQGEHTIAPGLDLKGDGGQIVAAPSFAHPEGRPYAWDLAHHPDDVPLAAAPAWLLALIRSSGNGNGRGPAVAAAEVIGPGQRNATLTSLAGTMRRRGMAAEEILVAIEAVNARRCRPPLPEAELQAIAASVGRYAPTSPQATETRPALQVLSWSEMTAGPARPLAYHWNGWVALATVAVLAGAGDSLKSWLCLYLACMTAAGRPAFGEPGADEPPLTAGPVVYLTAENAIDEERRRAQLLKAGLGLPDELPITFVAAESLVLGNEADYQAVVQLVRERQAVALFVDSAIALSGVKQENDNAEVRAFMKARILPFARQHGLTVYLVQHSPKPPMQPGVKLGDEHVARGAGDWRNAADVVLYLRRDPALGELAVVLRHAKNRVGPRHRPVWFQLEDVEPGASARLRYGGVYSDDGQAVQTGVRKAVAAAVAILQATPVGVYLRDLAQDLKASGITTATYRRALEILRGKKPWPYGPHRGKKQAVVTEDKHGKQVFVTFDVAQWPDDGTWDEA